MKQNLQEIANYSKLETKLPVNIWVDTGGTYKNGRRYKRIKFQLNKSIRIQSHSFGIISLANGKVVDREKVLARKDCELAEENLKQLENFVQNNFFALSRIGEGFISANDFLKDLMIEGPDLRSKVLQKEVISKTCEKIVQHIQKEHYNRTDILDATEALLSVHSEKELAQNFGFQVKF